MTASFHDFGKQLGEAIAKIPRDTLTTTEACALIASKELTRDLRERFAGWMIETAKSETSGRTCNYVSEEIALFVRAHRLLIEAQPEKD